MWTINKDVTYNTAFGLFIIHLPRNNYGDQEFFVPENVEVLHMPKHGSRKNETISNSKNRIGFSATASTDVTKQK